MAGADKSNRSGLIAKSSTNLIKVLCEVAAKKGRKLLLMEMIIKQKMEQL